MKQSQITRQNHYVPCWYQKGFITGPRGTLHFLDQDPPEIKLPNDRKIIRKSLKLRPPTRCFREKDLYTTRFGNILNDEVEKFLFGAIDSSGAIAARAFSSGDLKLIHKYFQNFYEYLNTQKLRTPKGLDWIKSQYPSLTQVKLMLEMQHLRKMHCTMWLECVGEIVSAEQSHVKFIITDHPVTVYNSACPPASFACQYPKDPSIDLKGTQTVFALDSNRCLILTNLEYARNPTGVDLLAPRQNARYSAHTLARTDTMIRTRVLTSEEVVSINALLKTRSRRYLAAYEKAWLFPDKEGAVPWNDIGKILLPPSDMLWQFGGETYIGYEDGSVGYHDEFGRTDTIHKFLKKKVPPTEPDRNDPCACGSGRTYRKCCRNLQIDARAPWDVYGVRDRNRMFFNAVTDILGLDNGSTWEDVRRELSDDQVKRIHEMLEFLWPKDTNLANLLPRPDKRVFRTVYMGPIDPRTITTSVISLLAYFDEIIVLNPFPNPVYTNPKYSPTESPARHKSQTLKNVSVLLLLQPFIDAGIVHLIPDPMEFNADLRRAMMATIEERGANWTLKKEEMKLGMALAEDDFRRQTLRMPVDQLRRKLLASEPNIDPELLERTIEYAKETLASDRFALLQPLPTSEEGGELQVFRSMNLELALFLAHLTGSAIYTDEAACWRQLHEHTSATGDPEQLSQWAPLIEKLESLEVTIESNPYINWEIRNSGKLGRMRRVFRSVWSAAQTQRASAHLNEIAIQLVRRLELAGINAEREWDTCSTATEPSMRLKRHFELSAPATGFSMNSVHRFLITAGRANHIELVPIALFLSPEGAQVEN